MNITAKITARGSECTTIDRGDGIEADVYADGAYLCSVTLLVDAVEAADRAADRA